MTILKCLWEAVLMLVCCFIQMIGVVTDCIGKVMSEATRYLSVTHNRVSQCKPNVTKSSEVKK